MLLFGPAALPAVPPVANEELKAERIDFEAGLEADAEVAVVHFVLVYVGVQETEMACDGKKQIIVPGRQFRKFILQQFGNIFRSSTFLSDFGLSGFWKNFGW